MRTLSSNVKLGIKEMAETTIEIPIELIATGREKMEKTLDVRELTQSWFPRTVMCLSTGNIIHNTMLIYYVIRHNES
jgi:hypothetical protein